MITYHPDNHWVGSLNQARRQMDDALAAQKRGRRNIQVAPLMQKYQYRVAQLRLDSNVNECRHWLHVCLVTFNDMQRQTGHPTIKAMRPGQVL